MVTPMCCGTTPPREKNGYSCHPRNWNSRRPNGRKENKREKRKHRKSPKLPNKNGKKNRNAHGDSDANAKKSGLHYDSSLFFCFYLSL